MGRYDSDTLLRSSLLNRDRMDRINASRETSGGALIDRLRVSFFGLWIIAAGVILIVNAAD